MRCFFLPLSEACCTSLDNLLHLPNMANRETKALKYFCSVLLLDVICPEKAWNSLMEGFLGTYLLGTYFLEDKVISNPIPLCQALQTG